MIYQHNDNEQNLEKKRGISINKTLIHPSFSKSIITRSNTATTKHYQPSKHYSIKGFQQKIILFGILGYLALSSIALTSVNGKSLTTKNNLHEDAKKWSKDHLLRFARSTDDDHLLRFAKADNNDHMLRLARDTNDDHLLRFARSVDDDHMLRFAKNDDHMLRFARSNNDHMLRFARARNDDHMLRFARARNDDHML